mmetsp:Transcript_70630/g.197306  ORF Transcript_70630/g.197306 Transcript_70630/m.197306 type:complete len:905 (-) Transcript_70630:1623-4337(-)
MTRTGSMSSCLRSLRVSVACRYTLYKKPKSGTTSDDPRAAAYGYNPTMGSTATPCEFEFAVCNTGEGLEHHPLRPEPTSSQMHTNLSFAVKGISEGSIVDGAFWFVLYRMACFSSEKNTASMLYENILPWLNQKPINANIPESDAVPTISTPRAEAERVASGPDGDDADKVEWRPAPMSKDSSNCYCIMEAIFYTSKCQGLTSQSAEAAVVVLKAQMVSMMHWDLGVAERLTPSDELLITAACKQMARFATQPAPGTLSVVFQNHLLACLKSCETKARALAAATAAQSRFTIPLVTDDQDAIAQASVGEASGAPSATALLTGTAGPVNLSGSVESPLFGRLRRDADIEHLAGNSKTPPIVLPVQLSLVPDHIETFHDLACALRHCSHVCTLLSNQTSLIKNTFALRASLIQNLFLEVIPIPLPVDATPEERSTDWWTNQPMRYETQADLLRLISVVSQHYAAVSLSLTVTTSFDATRLCTLGCMAAAADTIMRVVASDIPSQLSMMYNGKADGPTDCFCFECSHFAIESEMSRFHDPVLAAARTRLLDYFLAQRRITPIDNVIFRFDESMMFSEPTGKWLNQLCLVMGFDRGPMMLEKYLTGEEGAIMDLYPELGFFRDVIFLFKAMMAPTSDALPPLKPWKPVEARLLWKAKPPKKQGESGLLEVMGFGMKLSGAAAYVTEAEKLEASNKTQKGYLSRIGNALGLTSSSARCPPSGADPSNLAGQKILTEDDVLHIKFLPDFDGRLNSRHSELLLQYLTAPYLRIPLVLKLLSDQTRVRSLTNMELQGVLDSCLFEPGQWREPGPIPLPSEIPPRTRAHLSTPCGLMFNELIHSRQDTMLKSIDSLLDTAIEMDTGRYSSISCAVILYVVRLVVRVEGYILFLLRHAEWSKGNLRYGLEVVTQ